MKETEKQKKREKLTWAWLIIILGIILFGNVLWSIQMFSHLYHLEAGDTFRVDPASIMRHLSSEAITVAYHKMPERALNEELLFRWLPMLIFALCCYITSMMLKGKRKPSLIIQCLLIITIGIATSIWFGETAPKCHTPIIQGISGGLYFLSYFMVWVRTGHIRYIGVTQLMPLAATTAIHLASNLIIFTIQINS